MMPSERTDHVSLTDHFWMVCSVATGSSGTEMVTVASIYINSDCSRASTDWAGGKNMKQTIHLNDSVDTKSQLLASPWNTNCLDTQ